MTNSIITSQFKPYATVTVLMDDVLLLSTALYNEHTRLIAHGIKDGDWDALLLAAHRMSNILPPNAALVPMPSHLGYAHQTLCLARLISDITDAPVADVLIGNLRESLYDCKKAGRTLSASELGFRLEGELPKGKVPCIIDNVIDTGLTAMAAAKAVGSCTVLTYAITEVLL